MPILPALVALAALVVTLLVFPRLREQGFLGRAWMLLRALFPSWRFFEAPIHIPRLSFRVFSGDTPSSDVEDWEELLFTESRGVMTLFLNARGNLRMASHSLLEQLVNDLAEFHEQSHVPGGEARFEQSVSYELVTRLVRSHLRERRGDRFQFKVSLAVPGETEREGEMVLLSSPHEVDA